MLLVTLQLFFVMLNNFFEFVLKYPNVRFLWGLLCGVLGFLFSLYKLTKIWSRRENNKSSRMHSILFHKTKSTKNAYIACLKLNHSKKKSLTNQHLLGGDKKKGNNCTLSTCVACIFN